MSPNAGRFWEFENTQDQRKIVEQLAETENIEHLDLRDSTRHGIDPETVIENIEKVDIGAISDDLKDKLKSDFGWDAVEISPEMMLLVIDAGILLIQERSLIGQKTSESKERVRNKINSILGEPEEMSEEEVIELVNEYTLEEGEKKNT